MNVFNVQAVAKKRNDEQKEEKPKCPSSQAQKQAGKCHPGKCPGDVRVKAGCPFSQKVHGQIKAASLLSVTLQPEVAYAVQIINTTLHHSIPLKLQEYRYVRKQKPQCFQFSCFGANKATRGSLELQQENLAFQLDLCNALIDPSPFKAKRIVFDTCGFVSFICVTFIYPQKNDTNCMTSF